MKLRITLLEEEVKDILIAHISKQLNMPESQIAVTGYIPSDTTITIDTNLPTNDEDKELTL